MTVTVTGTTLTGCTIGPYFDPNIFFSTIDNQAPFGYGSPQILYSGVNNQAPFGYGSPQILYSGINNQAPITITGN